MALSRCTQKGERIEGLSDDAEPTSNVAGACCLITADAMMTGSYLANFLGWDNRIFTCNSPCALIMKDTPCLLRGGKCTGSSLMLTQRLMATCASLMKAERIRPLLPPAFTCCTCRLPWGKHYCLLPTCSRSSFRPQGRPLRWLDVEQERQT